MESSPSLIFGKATPANPVSVENGVFHPALIIMQTKRATIGSRGRQASGSRSPQSRSVSPAGSELVSAPLVAACCSRSTSHSERTFDKHRYRFIDDGYDDFAYADYISFADAVAGEEFVFNAGQDVPQEEPLPTIAGCVKIAGYSPTATLR